MQNQEQRASWVVSREFGTAKVEVSEKGAIAFNGNRFRPQRYENIADVVKPEIKAWLESEEVAPYIAGSVDRLRQMQIRSEMVAKFIAAGLSLDQAQAAAKTVLK